VALKLAETSVVKSRPSVPYGANLFEIYERTDKQTDRHTGMLNCWLQYFAPLAGAKLLNALTIEQPTCWLWCANEWWNGFVLFSHM